MLASQLRDMLYDVTPFDPLTVGAVLGTLVLVVFAASLVPARRATLIDPRARCERTDMKSAIASAWPGTPLPESRSCRQRSGTRRASGMSLW